MWIRSFGMFSSLVCSASISVSGQGLLVDQASGTIDEIITESFQIPDQHISQSFTPSLSVVGWVQLSQYVPAFPGNDQVVFTVNLRAGAFDGPILSSTDPVVLLNHGTEIGTFYYPDNITVTPGQHYFFEPMLLSTGFLDIGDKPNSTYPAGSSWVGGVPSGAGDVWFREGIVVPEPSAWALAALGAVAILPRWRSRPRTASLER